jgi:ferric-dicitrate binding protein FerR (iron transport regulator)
MSASDAELEALFNRIADGIASDADQERLAQMLRSSPEARQAYRQFMGLHSALHWDYVAVAGPESISDSNRPSEHVPSLGRAGWLTAFFAGIAVATVAAMAVAAFMWNRSPASRDNDVAQPAKSEPVAALLVDKVDAAFAENQGPAGVRFGPGEYALLKGLVHLRFAQGADMILAGPARFVVSDAQHVRLISGKARIVAPSTAKGFTVATKSADYIDLGTEFGLRVEPDGASDLYVFDGQVNVADPRSGKVLSEVFEGKSTRYLNGVAAEAPQIPAEDFPTPGAIGLKRWEKYEQEMLKAPGLIAFFPFRRGTDASVLANGLGEARIQSGKIVGARWVSGRWPGHGALLFDRDGDYVQLNIPGEYQDLTIASWLKVDRLDFELNAILNSDTYEPGGVHFQLTRQGYPRGGVIIQGNFNDKLAGVSIPVGAWAHVASVISTRTRSQQIYVNGILARERTWKRDEAIKPGSCRLGNWMSDARTTIPTRALRGRIDELAIWNRTLTQAEIGQLVEAGRPGLLWSKE